MSEISPVILDLIANLAEERNAYKRLADMVCDQFEIPEAERKEAYVVIQIKERFNTYLTAYTIRKSNNERQGNAAFRSPTPPDLLKDPVQQS